MHNSQEVDFGVWSRESGSSQSVNLRKTCANSVVKAAYGHPQVELLIVRLSAAPGDIAGLYSLSARVARQFVPKQKAAINRELNTLFTQFPQGLLSLQPIKNI